MNENQNLLVAKEILQSRGVALSPNKLYKEALNLGLDNRLTFSGKTPWASFAACIYMDIKNNPNTIFEVVQEKPILIKLKNQNLTEEKTIKIVEKVQNFHERDIHPILANFINLDQNFDAFAKTIYHEKSLKKTKGFDKWLYPDMVGVKFEKFNEITSKLILKIDKLKLKIYSFEIKKEINIANFRESYFQAVSNSSWANEGYLVALNIDESDDELMELIKKSSSSFGIGVISLNSEDISSSKIISPANFKIDLDLNVINELSNNNEDFKNFLNTICDFDINYPNRYKSEFDKVLDIDILEKYIEDKGIR